MDKNTPTETSTPRTIEDLKRAIACSLELRRQGFIIIHPDDPIDLTIINALIKHQCVHGFARTAELIAQWVSQYTAEEVRGALSNALANWGSSLPVCTTPIPYESESHPLRAKQVPAQ